MSTLMVKVCEECGKQSKTADGWLVIADLDLKCIGTGASLIKKTDVDVCSQGCLLRYISRHLERSICSLQNNHRQEHHSHESDEGEEIRVAYL